MNENTDYDELTKMNIRSTLKILQNEYIDKLDMKFVANITECDKYDMYIAINNVDTKLLLIGVILRNLI